MTQIVIQIKGRPMLDDECCDPCGANRIYQSPVTVVTPPGSGTGGTSKGLFWLLKITSNFFTSPRNWDGANGDGIIVKDTDLLEVFWNDVNRFLDVGTEWVRTATGFTIIVNNTTINGFDASSTNYTFYVYIKRPV